MCYSPVLEELVNGFRICIPSQRQLELKNWEAAECGSSPGDMAWSVLQQAWPSEGAQHIIPGLGEAKHCSAHPNPQGELEFPPCTDLLCPRAAGFLPWCVVLLRVALGWGQRGCWAVEGSVQPVAAGVLHWGLPESPPPWAALSKPEL